MADKRLMMKMKQYLLVLVSFCLLTTSFCQNFKQAIIASDIENFWKAYDKITSTKDSTQQYAYLKQLYLDKATPGLEGLIDVRNYTSKDFIDAINQYPKFWKSVKSKTLSYQPLYPSIQKDIAKLKSVYPTLKPSTIYFSIGSFRTGGTTQGNKVLIGSELSLPDSNAVTEELPERLRPFYKEYHQRENIALLCSHEYIHTQQKTIPGNLLLQCLYEGVAEFISCRVTGKKSTTPAISFGKANQEKVVNQFVNDIFLMSNNYNWLWGENRNELKVRDLGYYIGYEICERYYNLSPNKAQAIKELIELDYDNDQQVERIVDTTKFLPKTLEALNQDYERQRPTIISISPFVNGSQEVKPGLTKIIITFSEALNGYNTGIDFGPLGEKFFPILNSNRVWVGDKKSWSFEADLQPNQHYQILISNNFRKENGVRLKPYLIDFRTTD